MSSVIWTPDALRSECRPYEGKAWRVVEAQHRISTVKLVESMDDQAILEELIEATKPAYPIECRDLDFLLKTPFRYEPPYPTGSRFRRAGRTPGVFYAAEHVQTAIAEFAFYRLLFYAESPQTPRPANAADYTAFAVRVASTSSLDLTQAPLLEHREIWVHPDDYAPCQNLADTARSVGATILRYESVRDPKRRANLAILTCGAFKDAKPSGYQTWRLRIADQAVQAYCEFPRMQLEFPQDLFLADTRLKAFVSSSK